MHHKYHKFKGLGIRPQRPKKISNTKKWYISDGSIIILSNFSCSSQLCYRSYASQQLLQHVCYRSWNFDLRFCYIFVICFIHVCIPKWYCNGIKKKCLFIHQIHPHIPLWFEMVQDFQIEFRVWRLYSYEFRICSCESIMRCWRRSNKSNSFDTRYVHILQGLSKHENTIT